MDHLKDCLQKGQKVADVLPIVQVGKLRHGEAKLLAHGQIGRKQHWQIQSQTSTLKDMPWASSPVCLNVSSLEVNAVIRKVPVPAPIHDCPSESLGKSLYPCGDSIFSPAKWGY